MVRIKEIAPVLGVAPSCSALGLPRATYYRGLQPRREPVARRSPRALAPEERAEVLSILHEPRFADLAPAEVYATLLTVPELLATQPNELWSWDITKLLGPVKWTYYYLYTILDVFSRYAVGWMVAHRESATLAERLIRETCGRQEIVPGQLTVHADRGSSMISSRASGGKDRAAGHCPGRGLPQASGAIPAWATPAGEAPEGGVDQQAEAGRDRPRGCSLKCSPRVSQSC